MEDSEFLCAAAGRNIGTEHATKNWILYLDGDMEICEEFADRIAMLINDCSGNYGFMGLYQHIYPDGSVRIDGYGSKNNYKFRNVFVRHFGGAVLLRDRWL